MPSEQPPHTPPSQPNASRRHTFMLICWAEADSDTAVWRGYVESVNGRRAYFQTLADLGQILCAWHIYLDR